MFVKTITYTDYNGTERTENLYFNLTKAEVLEMEMGMEGGMSAILEKIVQEKNNVRMIEIWKDLILRSYGEKSPDGKRFIKSKELAEAFSQTEAYSDFFVELSMNSEAAIAFVQGITPPAPVNPVA